MITTSIGKKAEAAVAEYLTGQGCEILEQNYRTKVCEIDIVAKKQNIVYFVEVKYRSSDSQGDGLAYITPKKLHKVHFAAEIWVQQHNWSGDYRIIAVAVESRGTGYRLGDLVEIDHV